MCSQKKKINLLSLCVLVSRTTMMLMCYYYTVHLLYSVQNNAQSVKDATGPGKIWKYNVLLQLYIKMYSPCKINMFVYQFK